MNKFLLILFASVITLGISVNAQKVNKVMKQGVGESIDISIKQPPKYPKIEISSTSFENTSTAKMYTKDETGIIKFEQAGVMKILLTNNGEGSAKDLAISVGEIKIKGLNIAVPNSGMIGDLAPGQSKEVLISVKAGISVEKGQSAVTIYVKDSNLKTNLNSIFNFKTYDFYTGSTYDITGSPLLFYYSNYDLIDVPKGALANYKEEIIKDITDKKDLFAPKSEFESTAKYEKRKEECEVYKKSVLKKYINLYNEKKKNKLADSYHEVVLKIDNISTYNADDQKFEVEIRNNKMDLFMPPDEAIKFKENYSASVVKGVERLKNDFSGYEVINVKVFHPVYTNKYYKVGPQIDATQDSTLLSFTEDAKGLPKLSFNAKFKGQTNNNDIHALETCYIEVIVKNSGKGESGKITVFLTEKNPVEGIKTDEKSRSIVRINPGEIDSVRFYISADKYVMDNKYICEFNIDESQGFFPKDIQSITINTVAFRPPMLKMTSKFFKEDTTDVPNGKIDFGELIHAFVTVKNTGEGVANDVKVSINTGSPDIIFLKSKLAPSTVINLGTMLPGEEKEASFDFSVTARYTGGNILPLKVDISESYGSYGQISALEFEMDKIYAIETEVDNVTDIPKAQIINNNAYALFIGNENYDFEEKVDYAINDAKMFRLYAINTLGIPEAQTKFVYDASVGTMNNAITWLALQAKKNPAAELIFYYSGHGAPDTLHDSYLLPVDVSSSDLEFALKLDGIYDKLYQANAAKTTVFLDACFSGANLKKGTKGGIFKIKPNKIAIKGNLVIFSSSSSDEVSEVYREKKHGYFTYFLLSKIKETKGDITYKELSNYINQNVSSKLTLKNKKQTPQIQINKEMEDKLLNLKLK